MKAVLTELDDLTADLRGLQAASASEAAQEAIAHALAEFDARFDGTLAPNALAAMRSEHETGARLKYDADLARRAAAFEARHAAFHNNLHAIMATLREAPREQNPQVDAMRELAALQRFQGRTGADLFRTYQSTPDASNPTLIGLIERDRGAFRLTEDRETDAETAVAFARAIRDRQAARVPKELADAATQAANLVRPLNVSHLLAHLRGGRGIAMATRADLRVVGE